MVRLKIKIQKSGFTLIELLVVLSIIGILAAILLFNFQESAKQTRDKLRRSSLQSLQLAIETYKQQNGVYPDEGCSLAYPQWAGSEGSYVLDPTATGCAASYIKGLAPNYIAVLPHEPSTPKDGKGYVYRVSADKKTYKLISHHDVESQFITGYSDEFARYQNSTCVSPYPATEMDVYAVYSAGAECW
jgi:prepilin-type N-terminal cleavage/methylation domain-containing protein